MAEPNQDVSQASSSALAQAIASSPEAQEQIEQQTQGTQEGTAQKPVSQEQAGQQAEEQRIPYSRFKEKVDEANWYKQQLEQRLNQQPQQQFQQPTQDPYAGMTAEEEKFLRMLDARSEKIAEQKFRQITPIIDAGRMELAQMKVQQFRTQHPDVKTNSPEEIAIAEKIQIGYLPEDAYRSVMWDSKVAETEKQVNHQTKQKMEDKRQANVEQKSIPPAAVPPTKDKLTLRQRIEKNAQDLGF